MLILELKFVPDPDACKRLLALERFSDAEALLAMRTLRLARVGNALVPPHLCRIVAASLVEAHNGSFEVSTYDLRRDENLHLRGLDTHVRSLSEPICVWDASVGTRSLLIARALAHGLTLPALLAADGPVNLAARHGLADGTPLHELAAVRGLPHRLGLAEVDLESAATERLLGGCAVDALITYLLTTALDAVTGRRSSTEAIAARRVVMDWLLSRSEPHWQQFCQQWKPE